MRQKDKLNFNLPKPPDLLSNALLWNECHRRIDLLFYETTCIVHTRDNRTIRDYLNYIFIFSSGPYFIIALLR